MLSALGIVVCVYVFVRLTADTMRDDMHPAARPLYIVGSMVALWGLYAVVTASDDLTRLLAP